jgi:hypothetical protein
LLQYEYASATNRNMPYIVTTERPIYVPGEDAEAEYVETDVARQEVSSFEEVLTTVFNALQILNGLFPETSMSEEEGWEVYKQIRALCQRRDGAIEFPNGATIRVQAI